METGLEPPHQRNSAIQFLSGLDQHGYCVAQLAVGRMSMKLNVDSIWQATNGAIDILIAGIQEEGLAEITYEIKQRKPEFETIAVELASHLSMADVHPDFQKKAGGTALLTTWQNSDWNSQVIVVRNDEAVVFGRRMAQLEGLQDDILLCALLCAASQVSQRPENMGKLIMLFPPSAKRPTLPLNHPWC